MDRRSWPADLPFMGNQSKTPAASTASWVAALETVREHFAEAKDEAPGLSAEGLAQQAGRAAWEILGRSGWSIPNLPEEFRDRPVDTLYAGEFAHHVTDAVEEDWAEVEAFDVGPKPIADPPRLAMVAMRAAVFTLQWPFLSRP